MKMFKAAIALFLISSIVNSYAQQTTTMEVGQFEKLKIDSNINVIYSNNPDSTGLARFTGIEDISEVFFFTNKGKGTLRIQVAETQWHHNDYPLLFVYSGSLTDVNSSSEGTVWIEKMTPCVSFSLKQIGNGEIIADNVACNNLSASITTGNGTINVSGKCEKASFQMIGAGQIMADRLSAEDVKCTILGTGSIGCWAIDNLSVKGLGTTKIYYKGHPNIKKSGGGKLFELPEENSFEKRGAMVERFIDPDKTNLSKKSEVTGEDEYDVDNEVITVVTGDD